MDIGGDSEMVTSISQLSKVDSNDTPIAPELVSATTLPNGNKPKEAVRTGQAEYVPPKEKQPLEQYIGHFTIDNTKEKQRPNQDRYGVKTFYSPKDNAIYTLVVVADGVSSAINGGQDAQTVVDRHLGEYPRSISDLAETTNRIHTDLKDFEDLTVNHNLKNYDPKTQQPHGTTLEALIIKHDLQKTGDNSYKIAKSTFQGVHVGDSQTRLFADGQMETITSPQVQKYENQMRTHEVLAYAVGGLTDFAVGGNQFTIPERELKPGSTLVLHTDEITDEDFNTDKIGALFKRKYPTPQTKARLLCEEAIKKRRTHDDTTAVVVEIPPESTVFAFDQLMKMSPALS